MNLSDEQLEKYLAGTLSPAEMQAITQALETDEPLSRAIATEQSAAQDPNLSLHQPSADFSASIMRRVLQGRFRFRDLVQTNSLGFLSGIKGLTLGALLTLLILTLVSTTLTIPGYLEQPLITLPENLQPKPGQYTPILLALAAISLLYLLDRVVLRRLFSK